MKNKIITIISTCLILSATLWMVDFQTFEQDERLGCVIPAREMSTKRSAHTATLLDDGTVLICGGMAEAKGIEINNAATEVFDPVKNTFLPAANMHYKRAGHTATLLSTGDVLIAGGFDENGMLANAEVYRKKTRTFEMLHMQMSEKRASHTATLLPDGRVLLLGGTNGGARANITADIYDPSTNQMISAGKMMIPRTGHTATLLQNGKVLVIGGSRNWRSDVVKSTELFDPASNSFSKAALLNLVRNKHVATLLSDGKVLISGGSSTAADISGRYDSSELYDPINNVFTVINGKMSKARFKITNAGVLLDNHNVLVAGDGKYVEVFNTATLSFTTAKGSLQNSWMYPTVTKLTDGRVLITGGYNENMESTQKAWIYQSN